MLIIFYAVSYSTEKNEINGLKMINIFYVIEIDYDDDDLECNLPLLEGAVLSATSSLNERGPENARLNSEWKCFSFN